VSDGLRDRTITRGRPLPLPSIENEPFYTAARNGELRFQRCADCRAWRHYPRPVCPGCASTRYDWERASGRGEVHTWTIVHGPTLPAFRDELPYNVVDVLTEEGVHFQSQLLDCPPDEIRAGLPVEAVFVKASEDITLVKFRRRAEPPRG
jgi:uncharacterized OB-fold protein